MAKVTGSPTSPSRRNRTDRQQHLTGQTGQAGQQQHPHTPVRTSQSTLQVASPGARRRGGGPAATSRTWPDGDVDSAASTSPELGALQRCCNLLREAVVDTGSPAAALVPLRPSLRRIKDDLVRLLDEAVSSQNGNASLLVLGPPGTGKSLVVERALQEVCKKHNGPAACASAPTATTTATTTPTKAPAGQSASDTTEPIRNVGVVRLNGLLQPDERTAFQEVARQLCRDYGQKFIKSATFDENLVFLKGMLHALYKCLKKVVFVVDEFQQYAKRGKQQMLYYLLDMLQDSKIQAAVIGISSAHNVAEDLEKRVLSRVGRRRVLVMFPAPAPGADEALMGGGGGAAAAARSSPGGSAASRGGNGAGSSSGGDAADSYDGLLYDMVALHPGMAALAGMSEVEAARHNEGVATVLREGRVPDLMTKLSRIGCPPQHLALVAETALSAWAADLQKQHQQQQGRTAGVGGPNRPPMLLGANHLLVGLREVAELPERALVDAVSGLSVLSLLLLVAAHRLQRKGQYTCNFEMVWDEYRSIQGQRNAITFTKEAAAAAWQALPLSGLAHYTDANVESRGRDLSYAGVTLLLGSTDLDQGIRAHPHCPDAVTRFHMQEI